MFNGNIELAKQVPLVFLFWWFVGCEGLLAQAFVTNSNVKVVFLVDNHGRIRVRKSSVAGQPRFGVSIADLLATKAIQDDLALSDQQCKKLETLLKVLDKKKEANIQKIVELLSERQLGNTKTISQEIIELSKEWQDQSKNQLKDLLLREQLVECDKMLNRTLLRTYGWRKTIAKVANDHELVVSKQQLRVCLDRLKKLSDEWNSKSAKFASEVNSEFRDVLTDKQLEFVSELNELVPGTKRVPMSLLDWQVHTITLSESLRGEDLIAGKFLSLTNAKTPPFHLSKLGQFEPLSLEGEISDSILAFSNFSSVLLDPSLVDTFAFTDQQLDELKMQIDTTYDQMREINSSVKTNEGLTQREADELMSEVAETGLEDALRLLYPHQKHSVDQVAMAIDFAKRRYAAVVSQPIVQKIQMSARQKKKMVQIASKRQSEIKAFINDFENEMARSVVDCVFGEESLKTVKEIFGEGLGETASCFDFLIETVRNPDYYRESPN